MLGLSEVGYAVGCTEGEDDGLFVGKEDEGGREGDVEGCTVDGETEGTIAVGT